MPSPEGSTTDDAFVSPVSPAQVKLGVLHVAAAALRIDVNRNLLIFFAVYGALAFLCFTPGYEAYYKLHISTRVKASFL